MTKSELIISAGKLQQPSTDTVLEYEEKREEFVSEMNEKMLSRSDLAMLVGEENKSMMEDNHINHARFMSSVFAEYQPEVLVETIIWVFRTYRSHGFNLAYWPAQLNQWIEIYKTNLSDKSYNEIYPFYNWIIENQSSFSELSDIEVSD